MLKLYFTYGLISAAAFQIYILISTGYLKEKRTLGVSTYKILYR